MKLFFCGQGAGLEKIMARAVNQDFTIALFTHPHRDIIQTAHNLTVWHTTRSVNDLDFWPFEPDLIVSVGYLTIIKQAVLDRQIAINCHYSLLPRHRGRSSVPWAILEGDKLTGVTWHRIDAGMDTGGILLQMTTQITPDDTAATLFDRLHFLANETYTPALYLADRGYPGVKQRGTASRHPAGPPLGGVIGEGWTLAQVDRMIRAMTYPPLPPATFRGQDVRSMGDFLDVLAGTATRERAKS